MGMYFDVLEGSSMVSKWWQAWTHYCNYMFDVEDVVHEMLNVTLIGVSSFVIILFLLKIKYMTSEDISAMLERYRDRVIRAEQTAETLINAVEAIVDYKKHSITAAGYDRIRKDCQSAEALLNYLEQKDLAEKQAEQNVYGIENAHKSLDDIATEHKLSSILSEAIIDGEITRNDAPHSPKKGLASSTKRTSLRKSQHKSGKTQSVTFLLPHLE